MAASMCDVFSFCVGVAGGTRGSVEVRFVSSAKVRPGRTRLGEPRGGPVPTAWSPAQSGPCWPLLGPGAQGLLSCPGSWQCHAAGRRGEKPSLGACVRTPPGGTRPTHGGRAAAVLAGAEALGSPGVGEMSGARLRGS